MGGIACNLFCLDLDRLCGLYSFTPDFGYEVDKVTVNGEEVVVTGDTYTIENVMEDGIRDDRG